MTSSDRYDEGTAEFFDDEPERPALPETRLLSPEQRAKQLEDPEQTNLLSHGGAGAGISRRPRQPRASEGASLQLERPPLREHQKRSQSRREVAEDPKKGVRTQKVKKRPMSQNDPLIGQYINNLQIVEVLGSGGYGSVYRAEHSELQTSFAVKMLNLHQQQRPDIIERFRREARAIAQLKHENVVQVSDFGWLEGAGYYLVMEYIDGESLQMVLALQPHRTLSLKRLMRLAKQLCSALEHIHEMGIVHRDLKPSNIILSSDHRQRELTKLIDFGIATVEDELALTQSGICLGSPTYMAPEQADVQIKTLDGRTDLYSLGVVLYQALTGVPPFQGKSFGALIRQHALERPPMLREIEPRRPWHPRLEEFFEIVLSKTPKGRPKHAGIFWRMFKEAMTGQYELEQRALQAKGGGFAGGSWGRDGGGDGLEEELSGISGGNPPRRRRWLRWLLLVVCSVTFAMAGAWWQYSLHQKRRMMPQKRTQVLPVPAVVSRDGVASIMINSSPMGAVVTSGARVIGRTPCVVQGKPYGTLWVTLTHSRHHPRKVQLTFSQQKLEVRIFELREK